MTKKESDPMEDPMERDRRLKPGLQGIVEDVKRRVKEVKDSGPKAGLQSVVKDVKGRAEEVIGWVTGRREDAARAGETKQAAEQRLARETGNADAARTSAAKQAAEQRLARETGNANAAPTSAAKGRTKKA
jgi:hypothetical protein